MGYRVSNTAGRTRGGCHLVFSDLFGGADNAAQAQIAGINQGVTQATGNINQGNQALTTNYAAALSPFTTNFGTAQQGVGALGNALGLNGPAGTQSALTALQMTPGYQASARRRERGRKRGGRCRRDAELRQSVARAAKDGAEQRGRQLQQLRVSTRPVPQPREFERVGYLERRHRPRQLRSTRTKTRWRT